MPFYLWIVINSFFLVISFLYIWFFRPSPSFLVQTGQFFAQVAIILFLSNINMYFIFLIIRKVKNRKLITTLAKISRKLMKTHRPTAIIATAFILIHAGIMITQAGESLSYSHIKILSGYFSLVALIFTLFAGYLRHRKSSGFRRRFHQVTALVFTATFVFHLFVYI